MILGFNPKPRTLAELMALINPEKAQQPEVVPWPLYSTRTYVDNTTTQLRFFDGNQNVPTLDNVSNGQLPAPWFFQIERVFCDILRVPTSTLGAGGAVATGVAGALSDIALLTKTGNGGLFRFSISDKEYLRVPIRQLPASGGETGGLVLNSSNVAASQPEAIQFGNNGVPGLGGWPVNGMVVIPPQTNFLGTIEWAAARNLTADVEISLTLYGSLYRRVL